MLSSAFKGTPKKTDAASAESDEDSDRNAKEGRWLFVLFWLS